MRYIATLRTILQVGCLSPMATKWSCLVELMGLDKEVFLFSIIGARVTQVQDAIHPIPSRLPNCFDSNMYL